jgi:transposase
MRRPERLAKIPCAAIAEAALLSNWRETAAGDERRARRRHISARALWQACKFARVSARLQRFPTEAHIVGWSGLCPGHNESAGKRKSSKLRKGAPWLKATLVQCAVSASNKKGSYFRAQFQRLKSRRGAPKAYCAVAASPLTTIYHMLKNRTKFRDLGHEHFDKRPTKAKVNRLLAQLAKLGYHAEVRPLANAA